MASKNIKGITIKIGGETTELQKALKDVDKQVYSLNSDLKAVNQALKLDPKNTELLSQKYDILQRNISATRERLDTLKEAQRQMGSYANLTEEQKKQYNQLSLEIAKGEDALKKMNAELQKSSKIDLSKLKDGLKKVGEVAVEVSKKLLQVSTAVGGALASIVGLGVKSYASLEQNIGAIDKLFGKSADTIKKYAAEAYKTVGISANQYMQDATQLSAFLIKDLGGDTKKAADLVNMALKDAGDNANTYSKSLEDTISVYTALAKEQYRTLDNLSLGYAGTKKGMQELIRDAAAYAKQHKELGITVDATSMSFANQVKAINVIQQKLKIAGTTEKEAAQTITGSINSMKAAFDNFLNGSGSPEALSESVLNVLKNISGAITKLAPNILTGIVSLITDLLPQVGKIIRDTLPLLVKSLNQLIDDIWDYIAEDSESMENAVSEIITLLVSFITENLPKILDSAILLVITLANGISKALPELVPSIVECIVKIIDTIAENLDLIVDSAMLLIEALIEGIDKALPMLLDKMPELIEKLVEKLALYSQKLAIAGLKIIFVLIESILKNLPKLVEKAPEIIAGIWQGIEKALPTLLENAGKIIDTIGQKLKELPDKAKQWGKDMIDGLVKGIKGAVNKVKDAVGNIANTIKSFLHFSRPDTGALRDYETWMPDFVEGLAKGIKQSSYLLEDASLGLANDMSSSILGSTTQALRGLKSGIDNSLNPTINPRYTYDLNYQLMANAMKEALKEVQVELDDRELGKFIDKQVSEEVYS